MGEESLDVDRLSYEIFSILETKFLFGYEEKKKLLRRPAAGRVRVLSLDGGAASDGLFAAASLAFLEASLQRLSDDNSACIIDFFDIAVGSGAGGLLAALLFAGGADGRPLFSAAAAFRFLAARRSSSLSRFFKRKLTRNKEAIGWTFGELSLRHALKPLLITCYDRITGREFVFSRAAAADDEESDFFLRDVCTAVVGGGVVRSVDGRREVEVVEGVGNPAVEGIAHVLKNREEFPFSVKVEDVFVVSVGNGEVRSPLLKRDVARVASQVAVDMVDQAVSMAFGEWRPTSYFRIQASMVSSARPSDSADRAMAAVTALLGQKSVESVLFEGRHVGDKTNKEKLETAAEELVREGQGRKSCPFPVVIFKPAFPLSSSFSPLRSSKIKPSSPPMPGEPL